jgi:hypothetical protein
MSIYFLPLVGFLAGMLIISLDGGGGMLTESQNHNHHNEGLN